MKAVVTGGAGFIGSNLVDHLVSDYKFDEIIVMDNLSSGSIENLKEHLTNDKVTFIKQDLSKEGDWMSTRADVIFHYAASPDVRMSLSDTLAYFRNNVIATINVMEMARRADSEAVVLASSSTVYGEAKVFPTPEDHDLNPISVYGWTKLIAEEIVKSYAITYGIQALILRLANIVGPKITRGVIVDLIRKLRKDPRQLEILGDGRQKKSYLHVRDVIRANLILLDWVMRQGGIHIFNVGNEDWITVREIADIIVELMGLKGVKYHFKDVGEGRGWRGDVKFMLLDIRRAKSAGWSPTLSSKDAVTLTVREVLKRD